MSENLWWGYRHQSGTVQAKRFFGDRASINDAYESDFIIEVVEPFAAGTREEALAVVTRSTGKDTLNG